MIGMRRREFITLVGGVAAWPIVARAQQPAMPVIGVLRSTPAAGFAYLVNSLRQGLNDAGFVEGKTSPSSIAGRTISWIGYQAWLLIWSASRWQ